jgi:hypothetical protein
MANKHEIVDLISEATRQKYRYATPRALEREVKEERRLSNWPPAHFEQWRMENLTPWKLSKKSWKFRD